MTEHTFDATRAGRLEDESRYAYLSVDEVFGALEPAGDDRIVDLGSGTGFYTRPIAAHVGRIVALDVQPAMHRAFGDYGVPSNVDRITGAVSAMPIPSGALHGAISTMTYHEFAGAEALRELHRVLEPGARVVIADWSASGTGDRGPPLTERYDAPTVVTALETAGFTVDRAADRRETWVVVARRPAESLASRQS